MIAHARAYAGSSLHGRIVAMAFGLPRLNRLSGTGTRRQQGGRLRRMLESAGAPAQSRPRSLPKPSTSTGAGVRAARGGRAGPAAEAGDGLVLPDRRRRRPEAHGVG